MYDLKNEVANVILQNSAEVGSKFSPQIAAAIIAYIIGSGAEFIIQRNFSEQKKVATTVTSAVIFFSLIALNPTFNNTD